MVKRTLRSDRLKFYILWLFLSMFLLVSRLRTYHEPFQDDITMYSVIAQEMHYGKALYADLIDHKPPALFVAFQAAQAIAGYGPAAVFLLNMVTVLLTLGGLIVAARTLTGSRMAAFVAALFWTFTSGDLLLEGNQPNVEAFLNAGVVAAIALYGLPNLDRRAALCLSSLFLALATLFWQPVVILTVMILIGRQAVLTSDSQSRIGLIGEGSVLLGTGLGIWGMVTAYFAVTHRWESYVDLLFRFQMYYVQSAQSGLSRFLQSFHPPIVPTPLAGQALRHFLPFLGVPLLGTAVDWKNGYRSIWIYLACYAAGVHATIFLAGKYFSHNYQLWLPVLALGWGFAWMAFARERSVPLRTASRALVVISLLVIGARQVRYLRLNAQETSARKYGLEYVVTRNVGEDLGQILESDETFYNWGMQTGLYYWSQRRPPIGAFYNYFLLSGPQARGLTYKSLVELEKSPPTMVIAFKNPYQYAAWYYSHPVALWVLAHYRPFEWAQHRGTLTFYVRKGSALESRIASGRLPCRFLPLSGHLQ